MQIDYGDYNIKERNVEAHSIRYTEHPNEKEKEKEKENLESLQELEELNPKEFLKKESFFSHLCPRPGKTVGISEKIN